MEMRELVKIISILFLVGYGPSHDAADWRRSDLDLFFDAKNTQQTLNVR